MSVSLTTNPADRKDIKVFAKLTRWGPQDHSQCDGSLGLTGPSVLLYTQLFVTAEGYKAKSAKEKGTQGKVQRRPGANFQGSLPGGITWLCLISPTSCDSTCEISSTREAY